MGITLLELPGVMVSVGLPASPYPKHNLPPDPWGQPFLYESRGEHGEVDITSVGSDGKPGGTGDGADVNSRDTGT
jgi:type II secretion system protein G